MHLRDIRDGVSVMITILINIVLFFMRKDDFMMAMLWAQQIMLGKKTFNQVPRLLKDKVKEILIDSGMEELITEEAAQ